MKRLLSFFLILGLLLSPAWASQNSLVIPAGPITGLDFHNKANNALNTLVTLNSGPGEPATKYAYMWWADTNNGLLKIRNSSNDGWITVGALGSDRLGLAVLASVQNASYIGGASSGGTDAYAITLSPAPAALAARMLVVLTPDVNNTGACSLNVNGLGAKGIKKLQSGSLVDPNDNDLVANVPVVLVYDATHQYWIMLGSGGGADIQRATKSGAYTVVAADKGKEIACSGTFTLSFSACATLGANFSCWVKNYGSGVITLTANGSEKFYFFGVPSGVSSFTLPDAVLIQSDGVDLHILSAGVVSGYQVFTSSGTFTVPLGITRVHVLCVGGGGGYYNGGDYWGGGGGGMVSGLITGLTPGATVSVTVGAGGARGTPGADGGYSSFGSYLRALGGAKAGTGAGGLGGDYYAQASVLLTGVSCRSNRLNKIDFANSLFYSDMDGLQNSASGGISGSLAAAGSNYGAGGSNQTFDAKPGVVVVWW